MSKQNFSHTIWMGDLDPYMTEDFVRQAFGAMGENVVSVKIIRNRVTMQPLGYCFVEFADIDEGRNAMLKLNGKEIPGSSPVRRFKLNHASYGKEHLNVQEFSMFVGELSEDVDDLALYNAFKRYPSCRSAKVVLDNGRSRGYGFVRFTDEKDHKRALAEMQNYPHLGRKPIRVSLAAPKRPEQQQAGSYYQQQQQQHYAAAAAYNQLHGMDAGPPPPAFQAPSQGPPPPPFSSQPPPADSAAYAFYQQAYAAYLPQYGPYYAHQWASYYAQLYWQPQPQSQVSMPPPPTTSVPPPNQHQQMQQQQQQHDGRQHYQEQQQQQEEEPTPEQREQARLAELIDPEDSDSDENCAAGWRRLAAGGEFAYSDLERSRWSIFDPNLPAIVNAV